MYNQYISFSAFINGRFCTLEIYGDRLLMDNFVINLSSNIKGLAFGERKFFLVFANFISDGNVGDLLCNNISAYNYDGHYLYNIGEIIPKTETYNSIRINNRYGHDIRAIKGHEYMTCFTTGHFNYVVDITEDKLFTTEDAR